MKRLIVIVYLLCATSAFGAAKGQDWNDNSGIVRPDMATAGMRVDGDDVSYFSDGTFAIKRKDKAGKYVWLSVWQVIPYGRTYVGFKIVSGAYGYTYYDLYWK